MSTCSQSEANAARSINVGNKSDAELPSHIKSVADRLSFSSEADGAYHAHRHADELSTKTTPENEMTTYLREARQLLRDKLGVVRHNQNGTRSIVVESGGKRGIVTVTDGNASIATFGSN
jgi:hypothetical protein